MLILAFVVGPRSRMIVTGPNSMPFWVNRRLGMSLLGRWPTQMVMFFGILILYQWAHPHRIVFLLLRRCGDQRLLV